MPTATEPIEIATDADISARYGIYVRDGFDDPVRVAEVEKEGIGTCLVQLAEDRIEAGESEIPIVGILDQVERRWITSLWSALD